MSAFLHHAYIHEHTHINTQLTSLHTPIRTALVYRRVSVADCDKGGGRAFDDDDDSDDDTPRTAGCVPALKHPRFRNPTFPFQKSSCVKDAEGDRFKRNVADRWDRFLPLRSGAF